MAGNYSGARAPLHLQGEQFKPTRGFKKNVYGSISPFLEVKSRNRVLTHLISFSFFKYFG